MNDNLDHEFSDDEMRLLFNTTLGTVFLQSGAIPSADRLLDYRLQISKQIELLSSVEAEEDAKDIYNEEIQCADLLLSVRTYTEEKNPESLMLIENRKKQDDRNRQAEQN